MSRKRHRFAVLAAAALVAACGRDVTAPGPERGNESAQTDQVSYTATWQFGQGTYRQFGFTLVAVLRNPTDRTWYLGRCFPDSPGPMYGIALENGADAFAGYDGAWACVGHDKQFVLPPGAMRTDTFHILGPKSWDGRTGEAFGVLEGEFRLIYLVSTCPGDLPCVGPEVSGRSNRFSVRLQR